MITIADKNSMIAAAKTTIISYWMGFPNNSSFHCLSSLPLAVIISWLLGIIGVNTRTWLESESVEYATLKLSK